MKFDLNMMKKAAKGAARIIPASDGFRFFRFTEKQEEYYKTTSFRGKTPSTAGIRLEFKTDSKILRINANISPSTTRRFFSFDVYKNGSMIGTLTNIPESGIEFAEGSVIPSEVKLPLGEFSDDFDLGEGEKEVKVYFPWSVTPLIKSIEIDDGASFEAVHHSRKMISFGDSITHGYDALYPSHSYASVLADALDAEAINKGIGGETFCPDLAEIKDDFEPNIITVAYGTNDWNNKTEADFKQSCDSFFAALSGNYPNAKIFAITPIWRKDEDAQKPCGKFSDVANFIMKTAEKYPNVIGICGYDFVPNKTCYFSDFYLHPNDEGFDFYAKAIIQRIKEYL